jgi:hypothetical protein
MDRKKQIRTVDEWLHDLSPLLGLDLKLDDEGMCTFQVGDDVLVIEVSHDYPVVHLYHLLLPLPEDNDAKIALLTRAMELNAFQVFTRGGAIGTPPGGAFLIYSYLIPIEGTTSEQFSASLGAFYETFPELKKLILLSSGSENEKRIMPKGTMHSARNRV